MNDDKLGRALRSVGDSFVRENPADFEALREGVQRKRWRKWFLTGFGTAAVTATAVIALVFVISSDPKDEAGVPSGGSGGLEITASFRLGPDLKEVSAGLGSAFVTAPTEMTVTRVDADGTEPVWTAQLDSSPTDIIHTSSEIWVTANDGLLYRLDRDTGAVTTVSLAGFTRPTRLHVGEFAVRVLTAEGVVRIPKDTLQPELLFSEVGIFDIAMGRNAFWVLNAAGELMPIDPDSGAGVELSPDPLGAAASEITYLKEALWLGSAGNSVLTRIDEASGDTTDTTPLPGGYIDVDASSEALWVLVGTEAGGRLVELDPATGSLLPNSISFDSTPRDLSTDDGGVWVTLSDGLVVRVED